MILILVMAEIGKLKEALSLLENLQDQAHLQPRIFSNLAILQMAIGGEENYQSSKLYFKKYFERTNWQADEHSETSHAQLHLQYRQYHESANLIKKQILRNPGNLRHRLNLNLIIHQQSYEILNEQRPNSKMLNRAVVYFKSIMRIYEYMSKNVCYLNREQQIAPHLR